VQLALQTAQLVHASTNDQLAEWQAYPIALEAFIAALSALPTAASDAVVALLLALQAIAEACCCEDAEHSAIATAAITTMQGVHTPLTRQLLLQCTDVIAAASTISDHAYSTSGIAAH
jgi:hypothetical protein